MAWEVKSQAGQEAAGFGFGFRGFEAVQADGAGVERKGGEVGGFVDGRPGGYRAGTAGIDGTGGRRWQGWEPLGELFKHRIGGRGCGGEPLQQALEHRV